MIFELVSIAALRNCINSVASSPSGGQQSASVGARGVCCIILGGPGSALASLLSPAFRSFLFALAPGPLSTFKVSSAASSNPSLSLHSEFGHVR